MKNLLVPTDFSSFGDMSIDLASQIAKVFGAAVHVYHVADIPDNWEHWPPRAQDDDTASKGLVEKAKNKLQLIYDQRKAEGVDIHVSYGGGNLVDKIRNKVLESHIDMIIMGSHGISGKTEYFIGSNTQKVVRYVHIPVIILKNPVKNALFETVVYGTGLLETEKKSFVKLIRMLRPLGLKKLHIVSIDLASYFEQPSMVMTESLKEFVKLAAPVECEGHYFRDYSVESGIRHFSEEINADLIVLSNIERHPIKRILVGSNVELLVNHSELPLLTIDFP
jgi:nucleotide-binding universal stress UspA family protein